jgi:hypothetical protein
MNETQIIERVSLITNDQLSEIAQPGEEALNFPPPSVAATAGRPVRRLREYGRRSGVLFRPTRPLAARRSALGIRRLQQHYGHIRRDAWRLPAIPDPPDAGVY